MTVEELCDLLKVTRSALYGMRYTRTAPQAIKIGRQLRFRRSDVEVWIAARPAA